LAFLFLALLIAANAFGQDAKLIDAARKEGGKVIVYGSLESETVEAVKRAFTKKTGLEMDYWRAASTKVMDRAVSEHRVGKPLFDVILTNAAPMRIMFKEGVFAKYNSPTAKIFPRRRLIPTWGQDTAMSSSASSTIKI
jgi:iron(III) transport system substrate-binding protein